MANEHLDINLLHHLFPYQLCTYFTITNYEILCALSTKEEYWLIDFEEINDLPNGYPQQEYESKGFYGK